MILNWVDTRVHHSVERQVLAEVMHPAASSTLLNQIYFDQIFCPIVSGRVCEVNHRKRDRDRLNGVNLPKRVFDKVIVFLPDRVLILSDVDTKRAQVSDVRVDVKKGLDTVNGPLVTHVVVVVVPLFVELPVPQKSDTFGELMLSNPVLHPNAHHWKTKCLHLLILLIHVVLTIYDSDYSSLLNPSGKRGHSANVLG